MPALFRTCHQASRLFRICLFGLLLLTTPWSTATESAFLRAVSVLEDRTGSEDIHSVATGDPARFKPLPAGSLSAGYTRSVHWLRLDIEAAAGEWWLDIIPPYLDDLRLYEPVAGTPDAFRERRAGDEMPFAAREIDYRGFLFKLRFDQSGAHTCYLRLQTSSTSIILPRLSAPDELFARNALEVGLLTAVLAALLTVLLLNINSWFWLRDPLTPWFIALIAAFILNTLGAIGFLQQYVFPASPAMSYYGTGLGALGAMAFGHAFYRRLYGIERTQPLLYGIYQAAFLLPLIALLSLPFHFYGEAMSMLMYTLPPMLALGSFLSWRLWRQGAAGGALIFLASLLVLGDLVFFAAGALGHLSSDYARLHGFQIAPLGCIIALQIALGERYRHLRQAQRQSEREAGIERAARHQQGQFIAMLAHELRTALSVLRLAFGSQPMSSKATASAQRAMDSMSDVIERSFQAEKIADGALQPEWAPCDLCALIQATAADSRSPARLHLELPANPVNLETDGKFLRIIVSNLLDNAIKYGRENFPVDVRLEKQPTGAVLRVANPVGRAGRPDAERVFDKYYRSPQARSCTGSGLGLHIAAALANQLGGHLQLVPDEDQVVFELHL